MRECSPPKTCHVSCVTCHVSNVTCHFFFGQSGEAHRGRICYQWNLPSLVFLLNTILFQVLKYHHNGILFYICVS